MLPVLFVIGSIKIYTFGVFLVLSFFWGSFFLWKNIRLTSFKEEEVFDGVFIGLAGGLFLARLFFVILNFKEFGFNFLKFILINGYPGLSIFGFIFGFFLFFNFYCRFKKIKFSQIIDYFIGPSFLSLSLGKLGAFLAGVEVGSKTKFFLSLRYIGLEGNRHLTAFYEFLFFLGGFLISQKILFEIRKEKFNQGFLFKFFLWYFALNYFLFDKIKENHLYLSSLNFNYQVSLILLLTVTGYFIYYFRNSIMIYGKNIFQTIYSKTIETIRKRRGKTKKTN